MSSQSRASISPSIDLQAFSCPHCGALADQRWWECYATQLGGASPLPTWLDTSKIEATIKGTRSDDEKRPMLLNFLKRAQKMDAGEPFFHRRNQMYADRAVDSLHVSACFSCKELAIWVGKRMVYPATQLQGPHPNEDLPEDIKADFQEARRIVGESPRGAAALLRLCVQKLCKALGESGDDINKDIGALVKKGLSPLVQKALDTVRVIGNESVHPGTIDLRDNHETAIALFGLVNLIAEQQISNPKHVQALYETLPAKKLDGISHRDAPKSADL